MAPVVANVDTAQRFTRPAATKPQQISVGVLVDLPWSPQAGGHVKCWERFAEAAASQREALDLTVYFLGPSEQIIEISENARYVLVPARFGTDRLRWLKQGAGETDLARFHPRLADLLVRHDLLHATSAFSFSKTARVVAERRRIPLVSSLHTDLTKFTRVYTREIVTRTLGDGFIGRLLNKTIDAPERAAARISAQLNDVLGASRHILVSSEDDRAYAGRLVGGAAVSLLRRGIDRDAFNPRRRDRLKLGETFGVPDDRPTVLFAGRVDDSKNVMTLALAARRLLDIGRRLHVLIVGEGAGMDAVRRELGPNATLTGTVPQDTLAWIYASSDLFVFPSESEVMPNVVLEAKASGLPVIVSGNHGGGGLFIREPGVDGVVLRDRTPEAYATAIAPLVADSVRRAEMALAARRTVEEFWPSWAGVLAEDLLPVWQRLTEGAKRSARTSSI